MTLQKPPPYFWERAFILPRLRNHDSLEIGLLLMADSFSILANLERHPVIP
jgi:hypothetical protein